MEWTTACPDWERRIVQRESLIACPPLFPSVAEEAWGFIGEFILTDVGGQPRLGDASLPWLRDFVMAVFGAEDPETGRRHINEFLLMVSKKNAKSTIAAGIMLGALLLNWRQSAELLILSPTKEIADNSYKPIRDFIKADEELSAMLKVQDYFRTITHMETGATLKVVAADSDTVSGKKASFVFVDELHEFGKQAKASNMLLEATGGLASRPEGFVIYATTQSAEPPAGVFLSKLRYARDVRDGIIKDRQFLPVIYEFHKAMRGNNQDPADYKPEFWDRAVSGWRAFATRPWVKAMTDALSLRVTALEALNRLIGTGSAPYYGCRAWVSFNGTGTVAIRGSGNVTSITDHGVGFYTVNFAELMIDANYSAVVTCNNVSTAGPIAFIDGTSVSQSGVAIRTGSSGGAAIDMTIINLTVVR